MSSASQKQIDPLEEKVYHLYQKIGRELSAELDILEKLTDLIQIFKDNDIVALRQIYENSRTASSFALHTAEKRRGFQKNLK